MVRSNGYRDFSGTHSHRLPPRAERPRRVRAEAPCGGFARVVSPPLTSSQRVLSGVSNFTKDAASPIFRKNVMEFSQNFASSTQRNKMRGCAFWSTASKASHIARALLPFFHQNCFSLQYFFVLFLCSFNVSVFISIFWSQIFKKKFKDFYQSGLRLRLQSCWQFSRKFAWISQNILGFNAHESARVSNL